MTDPSRLVEEGGEFERSVLGAWSGRQPSDASRSRTLAALGVGGAALAGGTVAGGASASVAPKALAASTSLLKWLSLAGGLVASAGAVTYLHHGDAAPAPSTSPPVAVAARAAPVQAREQPSVDVAPPVAAPLAPPARVPSRPAPSLDEEVAAIDQARRVLAGGDAASALGMLDAYEARYPRSALEQEATELRIEALYGAGKRAQADKLAARFLAAHPSSPYARVLRALSAPPVPPTP